ncbi:tyrosine-type recombinase/integrase [Pelotomaculum propionicicum]|uniref:Tyrosine recombinase XerD n=1 Tax=Pelotomaculum propionicicum TaxID=258475 RepID=A0A4Y7RRK1_9FIRM|nr:tyrosine-type recombinase/integrase [Pelotomaculum propionicicum]NLI14320.1 tyrosine-type recombinase/integrase [Peptococcaceae bacterium]TEB10897.1 Tyrosine recombinase XerD [Pelotomaculum propionicicum]
MKSENLGQLTYSFFIDYLAVQKGLRPASIKSYRDTIRLFLKFVSEATRRKITHLSIRDLTFERVKGFLHYLESDRKNHIRTRNHRLAILHTFFGYIAMRIPEMLAISEQVAGIPMKRVHPPETSFLEREDISALFARLPSKGLYALRDRTLLLFLYNTGARVQEVADLRIGNLDLDGSRVRLHGKGDKWRTCPLWQETVTLLKTLIQQNPIKALPENAIFLSQNRTPLTRFGIYKIVRRHTDSLPRSKKTSNQWHISPHVFRHTAAVHLLESGVEVNVIRNWLGHVSLDTTNHYAEITTRMKEAALRVCEPKINSSQGSPKRIAWREDQALLSWLDSL